MLLFTKKLTAHGSGCQDVAIMNLFLPLPLPSHTVSPAWAELLVSNVLFRKTTGGVAGHCWSDSQGHRPGYVQMWGVWWQGHRKVVQRWSGGLAERSHQNDSHRKVQGYRNKFIYVYIFFLSLDSRGRCFQHITSFLLLFLKDFIGWLLIMWSQRMLETTRLFLTDTLCHFLPNWTFWVRNTQ